MAMSKNNETHFLDPMPFLQIRGQIVREHAPIALFAHARVEPPGEVLHHGWRDDAVHRADEILGLEIEKDEMMLIVLGPVPEKPGSDIARVFRGENAYRRLMKIGW